MLLGLADENRHGHGIMAGRGPAHPGNDAPELGAMTIADLLFLLTVVVTVVALARVCYLLARRRWTSAWATLLGLGASLGLYMTALVAVSLTSPQQALGLGQDRCFDDWCLSVQGVARRHAIGAVTARGQFYLVTVRAFSRATGISQRARDAQVYLLDARGQRYDPAPAAGRAQDAAGAGGQPLDTELGPGASLTRTVTFDLPPDASHVALVVVHGLFPSVLVIGDPQSFLHKPTIMPLQ